MSKIVNRNKKVAFMAVADAEEGAFTRMSKFTSMPKNANPKEYTRQYVDEVGEVTDTTALSPSIDYVFDQHTDNKVHDDIVMITEEEIIGESAVREIMTVDLSKEPVEGAYPAYVRPYAVIPATDGDGVDAYTYSGSFKCKGDKTKGTAKISVDGQIATFSKNA